MKNNTADFWINHLKLQQHPEGGWYKEVYRSDFKVSSDCLPSKFGGSRAVSTTIYFLLEKGNISKFHRIKSDELWHFYAGDPVCIYVITARGKMERICLGNDPENGCLPQATVPAGRWFASETKGEFSLTGCTVSPGFDFEDFEMAGQETLLKEYPQHREIILKFT